MWNALAFNPKADSIIVQKDGASRGIQFGKLSDKLRPHSPNLKSNITFPLHSKAQSHCLTQITSISLLC